MTDFLEILLHFLAGTLGGWANYVWFYATGKNYVKLHNALIRIVLAGPMGWFISVILLAIYQEVFDNIKHASYALAGLGGAVAPLLIAGAPDIIQHGLGGAVAKWNRDKKNGKEEKT